MPIAVAEYVDLNNVNHYRKWFDALDAQAAVEVETSVSRIRAGNTSNVKWFGGIGEIRVNFGPGYRVYLAQDGRQLVVLFGGGTKQRQQDGIDRAKTLYDEYKKRKKSKR